MWELFIFALRPILGENPGFIGVLRLPIESHPMQGADQYLCFDKNGAEPGKAGNLCGGHAIVLSTTDCG